MGIYNFISLFGVVVLVVLAWVLSEQRRSIHWHVVVWGIGLQLLFAWFIFVFPAGVKFFLWVNGLVVELMNVSQAGAQFLFGRLAISPGMTNEAGESSLGFILAVQVLPSIIFFSALMSILYFFNILPRIIKAFAYLFTKLMNVSGAESVCAASNIFVGVESALTIKPYLKDMTRSELCTILAVGMATVSSNVLAIYIFSLQNVFPNIAGHLISASLLSAPAALAMSKLLVPETESPKTRGEAIEVMLSKDDSVFEAVINGSQAGLKLIGGIGALLVAVLGLVALTDQILGGVGGWINTLGSWDFTWSLSNLLGIIFYPLTLIIGIPPHDAAILSPIIGERLIVTEVPAYQHLAVVIEEGLLTHSRSAVVAIYALCGFAHLASMAIFIGGISAVAPETTKALASVGWRALLAATLACLLTAAVAGIFLVRGTILLGV